VEDTEKCWNPILEMLPREKLKILQLKKLKRIFQWSYEQSPFYRDLYRNAGINPTDIKTLDDLRKIPKTEKSMLRAAQGKPPYPYGEILSVPLDSVTAYRQTSGTTGQPVYHPESWRDWEWSSESWAYILYAHGFRESDRVFLPFVYNTSIAFWSAHCAAEKIGCEVVPGGGLNTEARIRRMRDLRVTAFAATPTYVLGMADTARKIGMDPGKDLHVQKITVAGEPGGSIPSTRKRMEEAWGAKVYDHAGASEIGHWGYECEAQCGLHVNEALHLVEIEDRETGEPITEPGKSGSLIFTTFDRLAHPCIRFDSKDIAEWSTIQDCECGRTFRLLKSGIIGRSDDITKVKGVLLAPSAVEEVVRSIPQLSNEYEVVVTRKGDLDDITLKAELLPEEKANRDAVRDILDREIRIKTNLRFNLELVDYGTLPRYEMKSKRFKDMRKGVYNDENL